MSAEDKADTDRWFDSELGLIDRLQSDPQTKLALRVMLVTERARREGLSYEAMRDALILVGKVRK